MLGESVSRGGGDLFSILQGALAELRTDDRPVLVTIDDAHQLDDGGAALAVLAARSGFVVMASVRRGEPCPEAVTALWKDDLAGRLDLAPLVGEGVGEVMLAALGAPVDSGTRRRLAEKTGGNLLFLRELVRVGLARGTLVERGGVWMWDGPITDAPAVADLVRARLAGLSEAERRVVDVVALAEPIGLALLDSLSDPAAVRECEAKGILVTERGGRRLEARLEHPLYADVVRDAMRPTTSHTAREGCRRGAPRNGSEPRRRSPSARRPWGGGVRCVRLTSARLERRRSADGFGRRLISTPELRREQLLAAHGAVMVERVDLDDCRCVGERASVAGRGPP